jgi:hypothetical protein
MSLTGDSKQQTALRSKVAKCLAACGLKSVGTGTWERQSVSSVDAAKQFATILDQLSDPSQVGVRRAQLDHLWIYIDRAKPPKAKPTPVEFKPTNK